MHESVMALAVIVLGVVVLGVSWLVYLGNGGAPFRVTFRGLGISVDIARPGDEREAIDYPAEDTIREQEIDY